LFALCDYTVGSTNGRNVVGERLAGEVAIVTGSTGMGTASEIARVFAQEGARVVVTGRSRDAGEDIVGRIREAGGTAELILADVTDDDACLRLVAATVERFGRLTVLVNSAVRHHPLAYGSLTALDHEQWVEAWDETMRVSPRGVAWMCRCAIPAMIAAGHGSIVNIGSRTATRGVPGVAFRTASRGAVHSLSRAIAVDYAADGIRCNVVSPGAILGKERDVPPTPERLDVLRRTNLTRPPTTTDIAYAALFLASQESCAITGHTIPVDGGASAAGPYREPIRGPEAAPVR
jgi:NAD(P)-dependent dehydrogenase (short-subunit alcohol dehydrogenase family)